MIKQKHILWWAEDKTGWDLTWRCLMCLQLNAPPRRLAKPEKDHWAQNTSFALSVLPCIYVHLNDGLKWNSVFARKKVCVFLTYVSGYYQMSNKTRQDKWCECSASFCRFLFSLKGNKLIRCTRSKHGRIFFHIKWPVFFDFRNFPSSLLQYQVHPTLWPDWKTS